MDALMVLFISMPIDTLFAHTFPSSLIIGSQNRTKISMNHSSDTNILKIYAYWG